MKTKLAVIYMVILLGLASVGFIAYNGLTRLMNTLRSAVQPDERKNEIKEFLGWMQSGENNMRLYNITHLNDYLLARGQALMEMRELLDHLELESASDTFLVNRLDSLRNLMIRKAGYQDQLIRMKKENLMPDMMEKVLSEVDSMQNRLNQPDKQEAAVKDTPKPDTLAAPRKKSLLARLFSQKKNVLEKPEVQETREMVKKDTIDLAAPIKKTFAEFSSRQVELQQELADKELSVTHSNDMLTGRMTLIAGQLNGYLDHQSEVKASTATLFFNRTTQYIALAGTLSAILLLALVLIVTRDFQVILRTKKELEAERSRAENLARAKEDFLANMSHEIRTPLNAIIGFSKHIRNEILTDTGRQFIDIIRNSSLHLLNLLNEILDLSKLEAGQMYFEEIPFNVSQVVEESAASLSQEAADKNLALNVRIDEPLRPVMITGDPFRLRQVLTNLVANAIKFTEKGFVEIRAELQDDHDLVIRVKDTGIGISGDAQQHIFDKFSQADMSTSRRYGGTGLGLSIVKKIVELQHGQVTVESKINQGSTFSVSIPVRLDPREDQAVPGMPEKPALDNIKIMLVDDDPYNLILTEKMLAGYGAQVIPCSDGPQALDLLPVENPALVILDIQLPGLDGFGIRKKINHLPVVAISAYVNDSVRQKCKEAGFAKVFSKPLDEKELIPAIRNLYRERNRPGPVISPSDAEAQDQSVEKPGSFFNLGMNKKLLNLYYENLCTALDVVMITPVDKDFEKIRYQAHKLVPSTRHMRLDRLVAILKKIDAFRINAQNIREAKKLIREFIEEAIVIKDEILAGLSDPGAGGI